MIVAYQLLSKSKFLSSLLRLIILSYPTLTLSALSCFRLLSLVAIQSSIRVVDVTHDNRGQVAKTAEDDDEEEDVDDAASLRSKASIKGVEEKSLLVALPKQLLQFDVKVPTEDKDIYIYYYLLRVSLFLCCYTTAILPFLQLSETLV
jgi:hypothetical protein